MIRKIIFIALSFVLLATSCASKKDTFVLPQEEYDKFSLKGNEVFYEGVAVANFDILEFEYYNGKLVKEYSLMQYTTYSNELSEKILRFMHMKFPDDKIELKFGMEKKSVN
jgi:hypothetical protein